MLISARLWYAAPVATAGVIDIALTLVGQPAEYWAGDRSASKEGNPLAEALLLINPWLFAGAASLWLLILGIAIMTWKHRASDGIALIAFAGHAFCGGAWMLELLPFGYAFATIYLATMIGLWKWCTAGSITARTKR